MLQLSTLAMIKNQLAQSIAWFPAHFAGLCVTGLTLSLLSGVPARALTVTNSEVFSPVVLQVDGGILETGLLIGGLGASVTNVSLSVSLTKCGGLVPISDSGVCSSPDLSFNEEIRLFLESPEGTMVELVAERSVVGQTPGATVTWNFQDAFSSTVRGSLSSPRPDQLVSGDYKSLEPFSLFDDEDPNGIWTLLYEDITPGAPLSINSWSISVTDENGPGPTPADVPGPLPLFGLAAAFGWSRLLRKRIRTKRDLGPGS